MEESSGMFMLFGAEWDAVINASYDPDDPDCGLTGGFNIERIELRGYYNGDRLIKFESPAVVSPNELSDKELRRIEEVFEDELINNVDPF